jgi:hypothetical protein
MSGSETPLSVYSTPVSLVIPVSVHGEQLKTARIEFCLSHFKVGVSYFSPPLIECTVIRSSGFLPVFSVRLYW